MNSLASHHLNLRAEMFSMRLSGEMLVRVGVTAKSNIVFECETLAALVSLKLWSSRTRNRQRVLFVDNDGCKHALSSPKQLYSCWLFHLIAIALASRPGARGAQSSGDCFIVTRRSGPEVGGWLPSICKIPPIREICDAIRVGSKNSVTTKPGLVSLFIFFLKKLASFYQLAVLEIQPRIGSKNGVRKPV